MKRIVSSIFLLSALYDGLLGLAFMFFAPSLFQAYGVTPPNHWGYVQFPAAILIIFAVMFTAIAIDPLKNRSLMPYGAMLKLSYSGVVFYYWFTTNIPDMWKPFAVADFVFMILFIWAWFAVAKTGNSEIK